MALIFAIALREKSTVLFEDMGNASNVPSGFDPRAKRYSMGRNGNIQIMARSLSSGPGTPLPIKTAGYCDS
ncbi:hypothetical protein O9K51_09101 [Purpureocillium lavendulum]|uniref:Uncharacterized protein n=1 Tax=Purpureocillium lavendulum TaxID=1247861 RepID=A0AB34FGC7_9HYPO|nr:hypothetical protein O9K51_09101 [Purpureocillium lavendulum]